jgi:hypothetical protein
MPIEIVGTYNMSVFSGYSKEVQTNSTFASEYAFVMRSDNKENTFWDNTLAHLKKFIIEKNPIAVGLQEMIITERDHEKNEVDSAVPDIPANNNVEPKIPEKKSYGILDIKLRNRKKGGKGTNEINEMLKTIEGHIYKIYTRSVTNNDAAVSIIIDTSRVGDVEGNVPEDGYFMDEKEGSNIKCVDNDNKGRPLLMLLTQKGYLFVSTHGDQNPGQRKNMENFKAHTLTSKKFIEEQVTSFLKDKTKPSGIYITGDFNDRFDAITEFKISGETVKYDGESPYSCCHNWDSSSREIRRKYFGTEKKYSYGRIPAPMIASETQNQLNNQTNPTFKSYNNNVLSYKTDNDEYSANSIYFDEDNYYKDKKINLLNIELATDKDGKSFPILPENKVEKQIIPDEDVQVKNYLYKGDKVFSSNGGTLEMFDVEPDKVSTKSDHELVFITSTVGSSGGKYSRKTKRNKKKMTKTKKNRKYRKGKKSRKTTK